MLSGVIQRLDLALQGALIYVPADAVIDFHHRREGTLAETRDSSNRVLTDRAW